MKKLNQLTFTLLAIGFFAGAALNTQADSLNSKEVVVRTTIATPTNAKISGNSINAAAYSSKITTPKATAPTPGNTNLSSRPINASAYSSKIR